MGKPKERAEKLRAQIKERQQSNPVSDYMKQLVTRLMLVSAPLSVAGQTIQSPSQDEHKEKIEVVQKNTTDHTDDGVRAKAAEYAADVDFLSQFIVEEKENGIANFDLGSVDITPETAVDFEECSWGKKVNDCARRDRSNTDGRHCYRAVKRSLARMGVKLEGLHAYEAIDQLRKDSHFVEIKCGYDALPHLPVGTVVVQGKGTTSDGHIYVTSKDKYGKTQQECGRVYPLPRDNRRGSSGQRYGELCVFVPAGTTLSKEAVATLCTQGCLRVSPEDFVYDILKGEKTGQSSDGQSTEQQGKQAKSDVTADISSVKPSVVKPASQPLAMAINNNRSYGN